MCQLLAMNSSKPAALGFSFAGFAERGGRTDEHRDGWGIAYHSSGGCTLLTDHLAAIDSPLAATVQQHPVKAKNIVAHIRKATQGRIAPENTHPFARELWGKTWSFAHNGDLKTWRPPANACYRANGDTDSEQAFCHLLFCFYFRAGLCFFNFNIVFIGQPAQGFHITVFLMLH